MSKSGGACDLEDACINLQALRDNARTELLDGILGAVKVSPFFLDPLCFPSSLSFISTGQQMPCFRPSAGRAVEPHPSGRVKGSEGARRARL